MQDLKEVQMFLLFLANRRDRYVSHGLLNF